MKKSCLTKKYSKPEHDIDVLHYDYTKDISRYAIKEFKEKGILEDDLREWCEKMEVKFPWSVDYDKERLGFSRQWQRYPLAIFYPENSKDVSWCILLSKKYKVELSIRGGGHDPQGFCLCSGFIINMKKINFLRIAKEKNNTTVSIGAGSCIGPTIAKLIKQNLILPTGTCPNVGLTGLTLGGGLGFKQRELGLTCDSLIQIECCLADGRIVKANKNQYTDLFWAHKGGGGGNFGVVTELTFKPVKETKVEIFVLILDYKDAIEIFDLWFKWQADLTQKITGCVLFFRKNSNGKLKFIMSGQASCSRNELKKHLDIFRGFPSKVKLKTISYIEAAKFHAEPLPSWFYDYRHMFSDRYLTKKEIELCFSLAKSAPGGSLIEFGAMGGNIENHHDSCFPWRNSKLSILFRGSSKKDQTGNKEWCCDSYDLLRRSIYGDDIPHVYVNFKDKRFSKEEYCHAYWGHNQKKLMKIKKKYDPKNFFSFEQSIPIKYTT